MAVNSKRTNSLLQLLAGTAIMISAVILAGYFFFRIDMTGEKRYTLSPSSKKLAATLDDIVTIKIYLDGDLPPGFKRLRNSAREMLDEFCVYAKGNIEYEFIDPAIGRSEKERLEFYKQLAKKGLFPTNLEVQDNGKKSEKIIFPGALVLYKNQEVPLQLLKSRAGSSPEEMLNNSVEGLEYEFSSVIRRLSQPIAQSVAFLRGQGELTTLHITDAARALSEFYKVDTVTIDGRLKALDEYDALIIAKPVEPFSEKDKFVIDQFIMRGGKVLWFIDKMVADMDSLATTSTAISLPWNLNIDDQLFRYGVRINDDLLMDMQSAPIPVVTGYTGNSPKQELFPWPYFPLLNPSGSHPVVNNLNVIKSEFCNTMDTIEVSGIKKTILLQSSSYSRWQMSPVRISLNMLREEPDKKIYNKKQLSTAVLLEGEFTSNYKNRIPEAISSSKEIGFIGNGKYTKMIVVSDGDVISNYVSKKGAIYPLGFDRFTQQSYGNRNFILNCIDYLCDDSGVIELRGKEIKLRLLDQARMKEHPLLGWINVVMPLIVLLFSGLIHYYLRKKRFARKSSSS